MKIAVIGVVDFSLKMLEILSSIEIEIVGVLTKDKSKSNSDFVNLGPLCIKNQIDFKYFNNINDSENIQWLKEKEPDYIFCLGLSQIINKELFAIPKYDIIGYHPTLLPNNRGRHPLIWSIFLGLEITGSTFFFMDEGADSGDILNQHTIEIDEHETAKSLYEKMIQTASRQIKEILPSLQNNTFSRTQQDESKANYWRKRSKQDGHISFNSNAIVIDRLVRALSVPYPGAHLVYNNEDVIIHKVEIIDTEFCNIEPGKVMDVKDNKVLVKTYDKAILLVEHEFVTLPQKGDYFS